MENEEFDVEALNAGLNNDPEETTEEAPAEEEEIQEASEETHEEVEEEPEVQEDKRESKSARYQRLANERTAEREQRLLAEQRAQLLEQQLQEMRRGSQPQKEEDEHLDPLEKWQRDANRTLQQVQLRQQDMDDKSAFLFSVSKNPEVAKYVETVEAELAKARERGFNPPREQVLTVVMGREYREMLKKGPAIKREATARVKAAVGKPLGTKSNVAPSKTDSTEYDRLKDIHL